MSLAGPSSLFAKGCQAKRVFLVFIFLLGATSLFAEPPEEFIFFGDLLGALKFCRAAIDYRISVKRPAKEMILDTDEANVLFEKARHLLEIYAKDENAAVSQCVAPIINGIDILIYSNDVLNGKLESVASLLPHGFDDTVSETARFRSQSKRGWNEFFLSLESPYIRTAVSKISKEKRQLLLERTDALLAPLDETPTEDGEIEILKEEKRQLHKRFREVVAPIKELLSDS